MLGVRSIARQVIVLYVVCVCVVCGFLFPANITCYCNNESMLGDRHRKCVNNRCTSEQSLVECYVQRLDSNKIEKGCTIHPICSAYHEHEIRLDKKIIHCCRESMCNENINGTDLIHYDVKTGAATELQTPAKESSVLPEGMIVLIVIVPLSLLVVTVLAVWKQFRKTNVTCASALLGMSELGHYRNGEPTLSEMSSGTGSGCQVMVQQTISAQVTLKECLSKGTFGSLLYRGVWFGTDICIKVYFAGQKNFWVREYHIYQTVLLRHENILGFIAADSREAGTLTEYWMVCDYHPKGSLYNIMQTEFFSYARMLKIIYGLISGLNHLHMEIVGSSRRKPAITHRALHTKHVIMKADNTCCIADLSMAATRTTIAQDGIYIPNTLKSRYHAPELLTNSMNAFHFDSHLKADVYALGLCIWEVCWRTTLTGHVEDYRPPLYEHLTASPTCEELVQAVCVEQKRPSFPDHWLKVPGMDTIMKTLGECWVSDASARLPTLRIKKNIGALLLQNNVTLSPVS